MAEFYPWIKSVHISAVIASGALFFLRGLATQLGARWAMATPLRYLSYTIDTVLLGAALLLMSIVKQYPYVHDWLTVKVSLIVVYIVIGSFALKRSATRRSRLVCWITALAVYAFVFSIARSHHPLGLLHSLGIVAALR